jgi:hypothetical protein
LGGIVNLVQVVGCRGKGPEIINHFSFWLVIPLTGPYMTDNRAFRATPVVVLGIDELLVVSGLIVNQIKVHVAAEDVVVDGRSR